MDGANILIRYTNPLLNSTNVLAEYVRDQSQLRKRCHLHIDTFRSKFDSSFYPCLFLFRCYCISFIYTAESYSIKLVHLPGVAILQIKLGFAFISDDDLVFA